MPGKIKDPLRLALSALEDAEVGIRCAEASVTNSHAMEMLLEAFCDAVEATGGVVLLGEEGSTVCAPVADDEWTDLGALYMDACTLLNKEPMIEQEYTEDCATAEPVPEEKAEEELVIEVLARHYSTLPAVVRPISASSESREGLA